MTKTRLTLLAPVYLGAASLVLAHPGHPDAAGLSAGFVHPFSGLDHVVAMVAIGLWSAQLGGRARWLLPVTFVVAMSAAAAASTLTPAWFDVDQAIAASLVAVGLLLARCERVPISVGAALTASFAVSHGLAHGREIPSDASGVLYGFGFVIATLALSGTGVGAGLLASETGSRALRFSGWGVAAAGAMLLAS